MWWAPQRYFVRPPAAVYATPDPEFMEGDSTYGEYNYLRPGLTARIKTAHFEAALRLARPWFGDAQVIDFGCADGVFLPSLARHFRRVVGVDRVPHFLDVARRAIAAGRLENVELVCNQGLDPASLRERLGPGPYALAFCLETLEHVGEPGDLYGPKARLLEELFSLLSPEGRIVISVPTMVGLPFLIQRAALALTGGHREQLSWSNLLRAVLLRDTSRLEPHWDGGHLGFNHLRLEEMLRSRFRVERRQSLFFQVLYRIARDPGAPASSLPPRRSVGGFPRVG